MSNGHSTQSIYIYNPLHPLLARPRLPDSQSTSNSEIT
jgi:hypothetical protein